MAGEYGQSKKRARPQETVPGSAHRSHDAEATRAPGVDGDRAVAERLRRDQLEPSRAGQPAVVQGRAVAGDPRVDEEPVLVDQIEPIQPGRELAATEEYAVRGHVLELLYARAKVVGN